jgi:hypothetical protein
VTRYLIFNNRSASGNSTIPGSPEDIACDIARVVEMEGNSKHSFIAHVEGSPEATFATLKKPPRYAIELDQSKIAMWVNDAEPMLAKIFSVHDVIDNAYGDIMHAVDDLEDDLQASEVWSSLDLMGDMNVDYGFEAISRPNEYEFASHIAEYFGVQVFEYHPGD